jgi:hypothetical protein
LLVVRFEPGQSKLFEGKNQADRFVQSLHRLCENEAFIPLLANLAFDLAKLEVHSTRKGATTSALLDLLSHLPNRQLIFEKED